MNKQYYYRMAVIHGKYTLGPDERVVDRFFHQGAWSLLITNEPKEKPIEAVQGLSELLPPPPRPAPQPWQPNPRFQFYWEAHPHPKY